MTERSFKSEGLVLRSRPLGEADRLITILSGEYGKFETVARGARKTKSKLAAGVDLFTYGNFTFYRGKTWPVITGQDVIEHFFVFRDDYRLYPYGVYLAELTDRLISGEEPCGEIFQLLLDSWRLLADQADRALVCRAYELKLAHAAGYSPHMQACVICGALKTGYFCPRQGGVLCAECGSIGLIKIDPGTAALIRHLLEAPLAAVKRLRPSPDQKEKLYRVNTAFLAYHLDLGDIKSRKLLAE